MKKLLENPITWVIGALVLWLMLDYNMMNGAQWDVQAKTGQVQVQMQRRGDLVPNLVKTVEGIAQQERDVFEGVVKARAEATKVNIDASKLVADPALMKQFIDAQQGLSSALSRLIAVAENYPQIKSSDNFLALQSQLEGTENRIAVERGRFVTSVNSYNRGISSFPSKVYAGLMGFRQLPNFEAPKSSLEVPQVDFKRNK